MEIFENPAALFSQFQYILPSRELEAENQDGPTVNEA